MVEWPLEDLFISPTRWQYLAGLGHCSPEGCICINQHPMNITVSSLARIHGSRNKRVEMRVALLIITPRHLPANFLLPLPEVIWYAGLEVSNDWMIWGYRGLGPWQKFDWVQGSTTETISLCWCLGLLECYRFLAVTLPVYSLLLAWWGPSAAQPLGQSPFSISTGATGERGWCAVILSWGKEVSMRGVCLIDDLIQTPYRWSGTRGLLAPRTPRCFSSQDSPAQPRWELGRREGERVSAQIGEGR